MNIQIFPNWCKKVGVTIFILGILGLSYIFIMAAMSAVEGTTAYESGYLAGKKVKELADTVWLVGITVNKVINILILLGMVLYLMSKEKVEDEFIERLRLQSYQLTLLILSFFFIFMFLLGKSISAGWCLFLFFGIYLIVFALKKRFAV